MARGDGGTLWIVATPIGNLGDLSPRALEVLRSVSLIAAEDTRHTAQLLAHFGLRTDLVSCHDHNEAEQIPSLLRRLESGQDVALVSDAGTPLLSDPGYRLVHAARAAALAVRPVPGPCAAIAALSVAGIACDRFSFEGFLPQRGGARVAVLESLRAETRTLVFYESKHRIEAMLADAAVALGGARRAALARELTKLHETVLDGTLQELAERVAQDPEQRLGECVVVIAGAAPDASGVLEEGRRVMHLLLLEMAPSRAARLAADITGASRRELYSFLPNAEPSGD